MPLFCAHCGKNESSGCKLQTCSMCKSIHYCSKKCQRCHWEADHRKRCKELCAQKAAASQVYGADALRDIQKWVQRNGGGFHELVARALSCHDAQRSKHQTHVVSVIGQFNEASRTVELLYAKVDSLARAQERVDAHGRRFATSSENQTGNQQQVNLHAMLHSTDIQLPRGRQMFSVVLIFVQTPGGTMLRVLPLRVSVDMLPWWQDQGRDQLLAYSVREYLQLINQGHFDSRNVDLPGESNPQDDIV